MRKRVEFIFLISLVVTLAFPFLYPAQAALVFSDTFSGDLSSWSDISGSWAIESGELSQNDEVIEWTSIVAGDESLTDYAVKASVKLLTGGRGYAGILFRYTSGGAFWFGLRYDTQAVELERWGRSVISSTSFTIVLNEWYVLEVRVSGDTINAYVDGDLKITASGETDFPNGKIGFSTAEAHAHFDDVEVQNPIPNQPPPDFNVVPEYPLGTVLAVIAMLTALGVYKTKRIRGRI